MSKPKRFAWITLALLACSFLTYRCYVWKVDRFERKLAALAGPDGTTLGRHPYFSEVVEQEVVEAFRDGKPFWVRNDGILARTVGEKTQRPISEGIVRRPDGSIYVIRRTAPTFWKGPKLDIFLVKRSAIEKDGDGSEYLLLYPQERADFPDWPTSRPTRRDASMPCPR